MKLIAIACCMFAGQGADERIQVLIVHDEAGPMKTLEESLIAEADVDVVSVTQEQLPDDITPFRVVYNYVHKPLTEPVERACLDYARSGGRLVMLHHAISSSKRKNPKLLAALKCDVPPGRKPANGFYVERGKVTLVNVAGEHFITTNGITCEQKVRYPPAGKDKRFDAFSFENTEVFLNLKFPEIERRTTLLGLLYRDDDGKLFAQPTGGWIMRLGRGHVLYFQVGHEARDFAEPVYRRVLANCILWRP